MWHFLSCEVIGRGHEKKEIPCQDKTYKFQYNGVSVIALADGAGSAKMSHFGASRITEFISKDLAERFDLYFNDKDGVNVKKTLIASLKNELNDLSQDLSCEINDLASTLLFVAVKDDFFIIGHIGDGVIGYLKNHELRVATHPCNGEFTNSTVFVTSNNVLNHFQLLKGKRNGNINGFVMFSDGTENVLYDKKKKCIINSVKKIMNLVRTIKPDTINKLIEDFLTNSVKTNTLDDCSIAVMVENENDDFFLLDNHMKSEILSIYPYSKKAKSRIKYYDKIIKILRTPHYAQDLAPILHIKKKYVYKRLNKLVQNNIVSVVDGKYKSDLL